MRLKRLVANQALDLSILKEVAEGKWWPECNGKPVHSDELPKHPASHDPSHTHLPGATRQGRGAGGVPRTSGRTPGHPGHPLWWRAGMEINAKRVQRLWRQEGLKVPQQRKRRRLGSSVAAPSVCGAGGSTTLSYDFSYQTEDGRRLKWLRSR